jgi:hypothetical protein
MNYPAFMHAWEIWAAQWYAAKLCRNTKKKARGTVCTGKCCCILARWCGVNSYHWTDAMFPASHSPMHLQVDPPRHNTRKEAVWFSFVEQSLNFKDVSEYLSKNSYGVGSTSTILTIATLEAPNHPPDIKRLVTDILLFRAKNLRGRF